MREICHRSAGSVEGLVLREPLSIQLRAPNVWAALKCSNGVKDRHASRPPGVSHGHHYQSRIIKGKKKKKKPSTCCSHIVDLIDSAWRRDGGHRARLRR